MPVDLTPRTPRSGGRDGNESDSPPATGSSLLARAGASLSTAINSALQAVNLSVAEEAQNKYSLVPTIGELPVKRLSSAVLDWLATDGQFESDWRGSQPLQLDFSKDVFSLEIFQPMDFRWSAAVSRRTETSRNLADSPRSKGQSSRRTASSRSSGSDEIVVKRLQTLNLDNNRLTDDAFDFEFANTTSITGVLFTNLRCLRLKGNSLEYPVMLLPRLKELHLGHNRIARIPPLQGLGSLEMLLLGHNLIPKLSTDKDAWNSTKSLRVLDLSYNKVECMASDLARWLRALQQLDNIQWLQLRGNSFCTYFPEYQALVLRLLPSLAKIDNVNLNKLVAEVRTQGGGAVPTPRPVREELEQQADYCFGHQFENVEIKGRGNIGLVDKYESFDKGMEMEQARELLLNRLGIRVKDAAEAKQYFFKNRLTAMDALMTTRMGFEEAASSKEKKRDDDYGEVDAVELPKLKNMIHELDEALAGHTNVETSVELVFELARRLTGFPPEKFALMFSDDGKKIREGQKGAKEELSMTVVQQIQMLYERSSQSRALLIRTLAKFAPVPQHRLGELSITALGSIARGSAFGMTHVVEVITEMLIPIIKDKEIRDESCMTVVLGLGYLHFDELAKAVLPVVSRLLYFLKSVRQDTRECLAIYGLLRCALKQKYAAETLKNPKSDQYSLHEFANTVLNTERLCHTDDFALYVDAVGIIRACVGHYQAEVILMLQSGDGGVMHKILLENVQSLCRQRPSAILSLSQCKKVAVALDLLTDMLREESCQHDLLHPGTGKDNSLIVLLSSRICAQVPADALLLTAALRCLREILLIDKWREKYLKFVSVELFLSLEDNIIVQYIEDNMFKAMHRSCEQHLTHTEHDSADSKAAAMATTVLELASCTNPLTHQAIISVVEFLSIFSSLSTRIEPGTSDYRLCKAISSAIDSLGREALLFKLLEVPSSEVQNCVIDSIGSTDLQELDDTDITMMIDLLNPAKIATEEKLLGSILERITMLLGMQGAAADKFRSGHAAKVIQRTFEVIARNSARPTYRNMDEEEQKIALGRKGVALIAAASRQPLLRSHLRGNDVVGDMRGIMKNEEQLNSYLSSDCFVELTWTGRNVELLSDCLGTSDGIDCRRKQGFRILSRIANVLSGIEDPLEGDLPVDTSGLVEAEMPMWSDRKMRRDFSRDDEIVEDTTRQQEVFTSFKCLERILSVLERRNDLSNPTEENPITTAYQLQRQASHFVRQLGETAAAKHDSLQALAQEDRDREDAIEIKVDDPPVIKAENSDDLLLLAYMTQGRFVQKGSEGIGTVRSFAKPRIPPELRSHGKFFLPTLEGEIEPAYPLCAFFRSIYTLLIVPTVGQFRQHTVRQLRAPAMQLRLVALVKSCGSLVCCHVAAKLLRVLEEAMKLMPGQAVADGSAYISSLLVAAAFASSCLGTLLPLLEDPGNVELDEQQLTLLTEAVRLLRSVASALVRLHLSDTPNIQEECVQEALGHALSRQTIRGVVLSLLYDMEMCAGRTHGDHISDEYLGSSLARGGLCQLAAELTSLVLDAYPRMRYEVLEIFSYYEAVGNHHVRESFRADLLARVNAHKYRVAMERMLQARDRPSERIIIHIDMELPKMKGRVGGRIAAAVEAPPQMLVLTTQRILIMGRPVHKAMQKKCGHCPPESFCPVGPSIEEQHVYRKLSRIVVGPERQLLVLGWLRADGGEDFDAIVCHRSDDRKAVADTLCALSGPTIETRVKPSQDHVLDQAIRKAVGTYPPLAWHYAIAKPGTSESRLSLVVLTETNFYEFEVNFDHWIAPFDETPHVGQDDDHEFGRGVDTKHRHPALSLKGKVNAPPPPSLNQTPRSELPTARAGSVVGSKAPKPTARNGSVLQPAQRTATSPEALAELLETRERAVAISAQNFISDDGDLPADEKEKKALEKAQSAILGQPLQKESLDNLHEVEFGAHATPLLSLLFVDHGSRRVSIRFLDDIAREEWRQALAFTVSRDDDDKWNRGWHGAHAAPSALI